jgi:translation elongation factor EF-Tu-like GTPase
MVDDEELIELVEWKSVSCLNEYEFPATTPPSCAWRLFPALNGDAKWGRVGHGAHGCRVTRHPEPLVTRQAVP